MICLPREVPRIAEVYVKKKMRRRVGKILNSVEITSLGGYSASEVGRVLSINRENAGRGAARGKKVLDKYEDLKDICN